MASIGRPHYINIKQEKVVSEDLDAFWQQGWRALDHAYAAGIRYFDTAPGYGFAEKLLIDWLRQQQPQDVEVATKWGYTYTANFDINALIHELKEHTLSKLNQQWQQSQALLPYLSTYQIHSATLESGVLENQEVLHRLAELKEQHHLKIGLSVSGEEQLTILQKALAIQINGLDLFDAFQMTYNILDQSVAEIIPELHQKNKRIIVKEGLANGRLFPNAQYPHYALLYQALNQLANTYSVGIDAIALRFSFEMLAPCIVLSGGYTPRQIDENLQALDFSFTQNDLEILKTFAVSPGAYWQERKSLQWN
ncbi:MAG: aldo/keto reductase [Runella zeae]